MKIIIKNKNNESLEISDDSFYIMSFIEGLSTTNTHIYTTKSANQDGTSYQGNTLASRDISIGLTIVAENKEDMSSKRSKLLKVLNPKLGELELIYHNGSIDKKITVISEITSFPYQENFEDSTQKVILWLSAPDPYFKDLMESRVDVSTEVGGFEFPLNIPATGLELSIRIVSFITNILNDGDVAAPVRVLLKANGTVTNPIITNLQTGEFIKIKRNLSKGDVLEINTEFGNKRVEIVRDNGTRENAFNYIDYKSKFFTIESGDTQIEYGADVGENNLDVYIYYTPQYLGV